MKYEKRKRLRSIIHNSYFILHTFFVYPEVDCLQLARILEKAYSAAMLRVSQPVAIELTVEQFAADRDFAALREGRSRGGESLKELLKRLLAGSLQPVSRPGRGAPDGAQDRWRITYLYGDGRCDLAKREGAGERTLRNFPLKYLRALPTRLHAPSADEAEPPEEEPVSLTEFIKKHRK
jgi:hypothetical protein